VRFSQTTDLVRRLEKAGVSYEELVIPDDTHHFMRHANLVKVDAAVAGQECCCARLYRQVQLRRRNEAGARCGLPGASELSLLALTYWYSASISDGSSRSSNPFIRLSGAAEEPEEPFRTITWNESAVMPPSALREYVRSGAAMVPSASSPWQREQYTWKYFQPL